MQVAGKHVFIDNRLDEASVGVDMMTMVRAAGMVRTFDRLHADIFIVPDMSSIPQRVHWVAVLKGSIVADLDFLRSRGNAGASLKFKPAMSRRRSLWLSPGFQTAHPELSGIVSSLARRPASKWSTVASKRQLISTAVKRQRTD